MDRKSISLYYILSSGWSDFVAIKRFSLFPRQTLKMEKPSPKSNVWQVKKVLKRSPELPALPLQCLPWEPQRKYCMLRNRNHPKGQTATGPVRMSARRWGTGSICSMGAFLFWVISCSCIRLNLFYASVYNVWKESMKSRRRQLRQPSATISKRAWAVFWGEKK